MTNPVRAACQYLSDLPDCDGVGYFSSQNKGLCFVGCLHITGDLAAKSGVFLRQAQIKIFDPVRAENIESCQAVSAL